MWEFPFLGGGFAFLLFCQLFFAPELPTLLEAQVLMHVDNELRSQ